MSKWRPEGWKNPYPEPHTLELSELSYDACYPKNAFEAGADAMLIKVCEEIEKVKNPYNPVEDTQRYYGFERFRTVILALLRSEKEEEK